MKPSWLLCQEYMESKEDAQNRKLDEILTGHKKPADIDIIKNLKRRSE